MDEKPKRGRPPAPEVERRGENLTLRVRSEIKDALERSAARSGRSLSAEAESWLGQALLSEGVLDQALDLAFGRQSAGLVVLLSRIIRETGFRAAFYATSFKMEMVAHTKWTDDPYVFDQVALAVARVFEALRPPGVVETPVLEVGGQRISLSPDASTVGTGMAETALRFVAGEDLLDADGHRLQQAAFERWDDVGDRLGPEIVARIVDALRLSPAPREPEVKLVEPIRASPNRTVQSSEASKPSRKATPQPLPLRSKSRGD